MDFIFEFSQVEREKRISTSTRVFYFHFLNIIGLYKPKKASLLMNKKKKGSTIGEKVY